MARIHDVDAVTKRLRATECPAFWDLDRFKCKLVDSMINKLEEKNEEIAGQLWRNIVLELAIIYELMKIPMYPACSQKLLDCLVWVENSDDHNFIRKYETAFRHLILSFKSYITLEKGQHTEALKCLNDVLDLSKMEKTQLAAVYGIKSNVFSEYGVSGTSEAFVWARKALELDPSEAEWHFLLGKLHARQRNYCLLKHPSEEENECLENAYRMCKKPHTAVYLAASHLTRAKSIVIKQPMSAGVRSMDSRCAMKVKQHNHRALELFREAKDLNDGQCLHIMARCAYGFAMLPDEFQNTKLAKELAEKILEKSSSNVMAHSILSMIYRNRREFTAAILHAKIAAKAGSFGAQLRLLNLYSSGKREFDVVAESDAVLRFFQEDIYRIQVYIYVSGYFLFVKRDLFKSLPYFEKALELDPQFGLLKEQYIHWVKVTLNIFELMYNEVECALSKESYVNKDELELLIRISGKIAAAWPAVVDMPIVKDLVNKLKENATSDMRARPRNRRNLKGANQKKRKKGKNESERGMKPSHSASGRSKDNKKSGQKMRSSSDNRDYVSGQSSGRQPAHNKRARALSQNERSQSRDCPKKMLKKMEELQGLISGMSVCDLSLRPDSAFDMEKSLSQLSLDKEPEVAGGPELRRGGSRPNYFSKRSVSFDRQNLPQKRAAAFVTPVVTPSKVLNDKQLFLPTFATPSSAPCYESLTVENVEKLKNSARKDSLDSDDTLESQMSHLSLRQCSNVGVRSTTSASATTRSQSLDDFQRLVSTGVKKDVECDKAEAKKDERATPWALKSEAHVSAFEIDETPRGKNRRQNDQRAVKAGLSGSGPAGPKTASLKPSLPVVTSWAHVGRAWATQDKREKEARQSDHFRGNARHPHRGHPPTYGGYGDRRSPFRREPSSESRVVHPPGFRRRDDSATSTSSADSDYIGSRWGRNLASQKFKR